MTAPHARREYAIVLAVIGVLLAVGVPALERGQLLVAGSCILAAAIVVGWAAVSVLRHW